MTFAHKLIVAATILFSGTGAAAQENNGQVYAISPDQFGSYFEHLGLAADDDALCTEMVQNRSVTIVPMVERQACLRPYNENDPPGSFVVLRLPVTRKNEKYKQVT